MTILIPAFEPDDRLPALIAGLQSRCADPIIVVDDGSGPSYAGIFRRVEAMGVTMLTHPSNRGKGCALKTGFAHILQKTREKTGVVTADADGQHLPEDILRVASAVAQSPGEIVLGVRKFVGPVPLRSRVGNAVIRGIFTMSSGKYIRDTQTGLRGFPLRMLPWLTGLSGERFEYEMNMLLQAQSAGYGLRQIDIRTVYTDGNRSSHFRTVRDSLRVGLPFIRFSLSGILAAVIDYFLLFFFQWMIHNLFLSVVGARLVSSAVNYTLNRSLVFHYVKGGRRHWEILSYYLLAGSLLMLNYLILRFLSEGLKLDLLLSKILTEAILFVFSFVAQHLFVFRGRVPVEGNS